MSRLKLLCGLLVLVLILAGALAVAWKTGLLGVTYTAKATLELNCSEPYILSGKAKKYDPVEFEEFRKTQQHLLKNYNVIKAALNDPRLKNRSCIAREDVRHDSIAWLTEAVHVSSPSDSAGLMVVSSTQPDKNDAAAIVNAVVEAYMTQVVDKDRTVRRERLEQLNEISINMEDEVRMKKEQLKQQLANMGIGDEETMQTRATVAAAMYSDWERQFQSMRAEHRVLAGRFEDAKASLKDIESPDAEIAQLEVEAVLNNNPVYRDLQNRLMLLEAKTPRPVAGSVPADKPFTGAIEVQAELAATKGQLEELREKSRDMVRNAMRIGLQGEIKHLERQLEVSTEQMASFEKEVEKKRAEAEYVGRTSVEGRCRRTKSIFRKRSSRTWSRRRSGSALGSMPQAECASSAIPAPAEVPDSPG